MKTFPTLFLLFIALNAVLNGHTQDSAQHVMVVNLEDDLVIPEHYIVSYTNVPLTIDGMADEKQWKQADWTNDFVDIEGSKKPHYLTKVKMLWDSTFLYIYGELEENHIWGNLRQQDTVIFYNNDFEVFIDPSNDTRNYAEIEINALNTVWDLNLDKPYRVGGKAKNHWSLPNLKTAIQYYGTLNNGSDIDSMWAIEMAIPMDALVELKNKPRFLPQEGEQWRINFSRVQWDHQLIDGMYEKSKINGKLKNEYNWVWSNQKVINMHQPEKWGFIQFTLNENSDVEWTSYPTDFNLEQMTYAIFRKVFKGELNHLRAKKTGFQQHFLLQANKEFAALAIFTKTEFGFEIKLKNEVTNEWYLINEEGNFKIK